MASLVDVPPLYSSGEFSALPFKEADATLCTSGVFHMHKNRYGNVLPPDSSRIVLSNGDYINANMMDVGDGYAPMIACQGPIESTISDFWSMVIQHRAPAILMVTPLIEKQKAKCAKYWPDLGKSCYYAGNEIKCVRSTNLSENLVVSLLEIAECSRSKPEYHRLYHIYYSGMPDFGTADLDEIHLVLCLLISVLPDLRPFVCHCSAGIGRTGVIGAILRCLRTDEPPVEAIRRLRDQRHGMVQNVKQFRMIRAFVNFIRDSA
jgi:protein tyrosine phosphatase